MNLKALVFALFSSSSVVLGQYLYDEDLYLYKPNERGIHYNTIPVLSGELLQKLKAYLPPTYPKSLKKYKVDWVL